jgi:hypothetical protein
MCLLNGKESFDIPNVPAAHKLLRFNVLFAYIFEAVAGGKGMMHLKIDPSKQQTISALLNETFPAIECFDHEKLPVVNPTLIAYVHALVIDCITLTFSDSINSRALEHEGAMLEVYSKMKPDAFRSQLQTVLTTYFEEIKGVMSASGCPKSKVVKRKFEDQDDADADADADAAAAAAADVPAAAPPAAAPPATPATPPEGAAANAPGGEEPPAAPSQSGAGKGARAGGARRVGSKG